MNAITGNDQDRVKIRITTNSQCSALDETPGSDDPVKLELHPTRDQGKKRIEGSLAPCPRNATKRWWESEVLKDRCLGRFRRRF